MVNYTWKMQNVLNRKKNHISDFSDFLFFELWSFLYWKHPNFRWIFTITWKIKIEKLIFHSIQHIPIFHQNGSKTDEGGLHIHSWEKAQFFWLSWNQMETVWFWNKKKMKVLELACGFSTGKHSQIRSLSY